MVDETNVLASTLFTRVNMQIPKQVENRVNNATQRCTDENHRMYKNYGGRGIQIYPIWLKNWRAFAEYLMTLPGWNDASLVLDRIDNNGNYEPGNLRFVTWTESNHNRRKQIWKQSTVLGAIRQQAGLSSRDAARETGVSRTTILKFERCGRLPNEAMMQHLIAYYHELTDTLSK